MLGIIRIAIFAFIAIETTGCATILAGRSQTVTVTTAPSGARCELIREGRVIGSVDNTPGAVTLEKTKHDIDVVCRKDGFTDSKGFADSGIEGATFGNIILGGLIGWGIDSAVGADNKYPEVFNVNLVPAIPEPTRAGSSGPVVRPVAFSPTVTGPEAKQSSSVEKRLARLKKLRDEGLLTEDEYQKKRAELVSQL
jgi:hypothetical protein